MIVLTNERTTFIKYSIGFCTSHYSVTVCC